MYALVAVLSLVVAALAVRVFGDRDRRALPGLAVALAAVALAHNWGLFLAAATVAAGVLTGLHRAPAAERHARLRDGGLVLGAVALLYAAWLPTLLSQAAHTGAPWSQTPGLADLLETITGALGGTAPALVALGVGGVAAAAARVRQRDARGVRGAGEARPSTAGLLAASALGTIGLAFAASQVEPAWAGRYAAVLVGPLVLLCASLLARAGGAGIVALAVVVALGVVDPRTGRLETKDNVRAVAAALRAAGVGAGDVIVSTHPERGPVLRHYLGAGPDYADLLGPVRDPRVFDWRDALDRLRTTSPRRVLDRVLRGTPAGGRLVIVSPEVRVGRWTAPWTRLVRDQTVEWSRLLERDRRLRLVATIPPAGTYPQPRTVRAAVYRRR